MGIKKVRFYGKCCVCSNPFTIKTDPENEDYEVEEGVTRNFEAWKIVDAEKKAAEEERQRAEMGDAMKALEHRTIESKREIDNLDDLDALKALSRHAEKVDMDQLMEKVRSRGKKDPAETSTNDQDDASLLESFRKQRKRIRRLDDDDDDGQPNRAKKLVDMSSHAVSDERRALPSFVPKVTIRKRRKTSRPSDETTAVRKPVLPPSLPMKAPEKTARNDKTPSSGLLSGDYGSSSSSSSEEEE